MVWGVWEMWGDRDEMSKNKQEYRFTQDIIREFEKFLAANE